MAAVPEHDWIINLAGASIFNRWTEARKQEIMESRERTTRNLVAALATGDRRQLFCTPRRWESTGPGERRNSRKTPHPTPVFWGRWPKWEAEAMKAQDLGIRVVITRFGVVLGRAAAPCLRWAPVQEVFRGTHRLRGPMVFLDSPGRPRSGLPVHPGKPADFRPGKLHRAQPGAQPGTGPRPGPGLAPPQLYANPGIHAASGAGRICRNFAHRAESIAQAAAGRGLHL